MSYDIYLRYQDGGRAYLSQQHTITGGTYVLGGTDEAWLNVTYNYASHFEAVLGPVGIRSIYGLEAKESIPILKAAAKKLRGRPSRDYWEPTEGNAKKALLDLVRLAKIAPSGTVWDGD
jgi:hypothetical protein